MHRLHTKVESDFDSDADGSICGIYVVQAITVAG
jgi:hypothetical protein